MSETGPTADVVRKKPTICLIASAGGHLTQLLLLSGAWKGYRCVCISTLETARKKLEQHGETHIVGECNRNHPIRTALVFLRCFNIIRQERPDVVISTGAAVGFLACLCAKLLKVKIVWVDSIANVPRLSLSGRMIRLFCDLILTQWPEVAAKCNNVEYVGSLI